jgi:hypothetical protein
VAQVLLSWRPVQRHPLRAATDRRHAPSVSRHNSRNIASSSHR